MNLKFRIALFLALITSQIVLSQTQRRVMFPSKDGLTMTADMYETKTEDPFIVLFHMAKSSRGEYKEIAQRFNKLELNAMAADLRCGREDKFIPNETNALAVRMGLDTKYLDAEQDMETAINNAYHIAKRPVIVMGSSYSASLALKLAKGNPKVKAVIAMSPGQYFGNKLDMAEVCKDFDKPVFMSCSAKERKYVQELSALMDKSKTVFFAPTEGGDHGSRSLEPDCEENTIYWIQLINFVQTVKSSY